MNQVMAVIGVKKIFYCFSYKNFSLNCRLYSVYRMQSALPIDRYRRFLKMTDSQITWLRFLGSRRDWRKHSIRCSSVVSLYKRHCSKGITNVHLIHPRCKQGRIRPRV